MPIRVYLLEYPHCFTNNNIIYDAGICSRDTYSETKNEKKKNPLNRVVRSTACLSVILLCCYLCYYIFIILAGDRQPAREISTGA